MPKSTGLLDLVSNYMSWAASLDSEQRFWLWAWAMALLMVYVIIENFGAEWMQDDYDPEE